MKQMADSRGEINPKEVEAIAMVGGKVFGLAKRTPENMMAIDLFETFLEWIEAPPQSTIDRMTQTGRQMTNSLPTGQDEALQGFNTFLNKLIEDCTERQAFAAVTLGFQFIFRIGVLAASSGRS